MPIGRCPRCGEYYTYNQNDIDYVHECNSGDTVLDQEDIVVTGDWEDYTGSGTVNTQSQLQNDTNKLFYKQPHEFLSPKTERGNSANTHRQRQHLEYIKLK